jgi:hypothetical protein
LKIDAERAVRRVRGVEAINDHVETLPVSANDDTVRWHAYYAIYEDPFLARYAPGGGVLWGHRHLVPDYFLPLGPKRFPGTEPAGDYPIHIIVKNGRITLLGVVDSDSDKDAAAFRAREVHGAFGVDNELVVHHWAEATRRSRRSGIAMFQQFEIARLVKCIEAEFRELPGLRLTERQMQRLWDLDRDTCTAVIEVLVRSRVLVKAEGEIVARARAPEMNRF